MDFILSRNVCGMETFKFKSNDIIFLLNTIAYINESPPLLSIKLFERSSFYNCFYKLYYFLIALANYEAPLLVI